MHCPPLEELRGYAEGTIPEDSAETVALHMAGCATCRDQLTRLEREGHWLRDVIHATSSDAFSQEPELQRLLAGSAAMMAAAQPVRRSSPDRTLPGKNLGPYRLVSKLGEGGMGAVFEAVHDKLRRTVAIKVLPSHALRDATAVARFEQEMVAIGSLDSPHIVRAHDAGQVGDEHFLVMEYVAGLNAAQLLQRHGPLPPAAAAEVVRQAAVGLQYAHERGLVHRDLKPSNLMVTPTGQVKILDLGLARLSHADLPELTSSRQTMGTPDYLAPEQINASHDVDIRADLYSLGCTLFALLVGQPPFAGENYATPVRKLWGQVHDAPPNLQAILPNVPQPLAAIVERLLAKDPAQRFAQPLDLAKALESLTTGQSLADHVQQAMHSPPIDQSLPSIDTRSGRRQASTGPTKSLAKTLSRSNKLAAGRRIWLGALALIALLTAGAALAGVIYVVTDQGTLKIETIDDSVQVIVTQNGKEVEVIDLKEKKSIKLWSGVYRLKLAKGKPGLNLETDAVRLVRGKETVATITRQLQPFAKAQAADDTSPRLSNVVDGNAPPNVARHLSNYRVVELGKLVGTYANHPTGINNKGEIVGYGQKPGKGHLAFYYSPATGKLRRIGPPDAESSRAMDINEQGQIVGAVQNHDASAEVPALIEGDNATLLSAKSDGGPLPGVANCINEKGQIVGSVNNRGAFRYEYGKLTMLEPLPNEEASHAYAINNSSVIVGGAMLQNLNLLVGDTYILSAARPFRITSGARKENLGVFGPFFSVHAQAINDKGDITGYASTPGKQNSQPYTYSNGKFTALGTLGGAESRAEAINIHGDIVGFSQTADGSTHAFLWFNGQLVDVHPADWNYSHATDINDHGQIVGWGRKQKVGTWEAFTLIPDRIVVGDVVTGKIPGQSPTPADATNAVPDKAWPMLMPTMPSIAITLPQQAATQYDIAEIGPFPQSTWNHVCHITDDGRVIGNIYARGEPKTVYQPFEASAETGWKPKALGEPGMIISRVNRRGQAVGRMVPEIGSKGVAILYEHGELRRIGERFLPLSSNVVDINDAGEILVETSSENAIATNYLLSAGKWQEISGFVSCRGINNQGMIVGNRKNAAGWSEACYRTPDGKIDSIPRMEQYLNSVGNGIGELGEVLGSATDWPDRSKPHTAFLYRNGKHVPVGFSNVTSFSLPDKLLGIDFVPSGGPQARLWDRGRVIDLHPVGWSNSWTGGISLSGVIAGHGITSDGHSRAFVLVPKQSPLPTADPRQRLTELTTKVENLRTGAPAKTEVIQLRDELQAIQSKSPGTPLAIEAAVQLSRLPWAADELQPADIPARELEQLPKQEPASLGSGQIVAVLGTESYAPWNKIGPFAFASDGETFATGGRDMLAHIRKLGQKEPLHELVGHARRLFDVAFSPDGSHLVTTSDPYENPRAWTVNTGELMVRLGKGSFVGRVSPDGQTIATGCGLNATASHPSGNIEIGRFDGQPGRSLAMSSNYINALAWSPDGTRLVAGSGQIIKLWDWQRGLELRVIADLEWSNPGQWNYALSLAFDPRGENFALAGNGHHVLVWSALDKQKGVRTLRGHRAPVFSVDYSPDGRWLASAALDGSVRIWDVKDDMQRHAFQLADGPLVEGQQVYFPRVQFLPDSRHVAASVGTGKLFILRLAKFGQDEQSQDASQLPVPTDMRIGSDKSSAN